jgi:hypothetical protein
VLNTWGAKGVDMGHIVEVAGLLAPEMRRE